MDLRCRPWYPRTDGCYATMVVMWRPTSATARNSFPAAQSSKECRENNGKLSPSGLERALDTFPNHPPHSPPATALSITQGTECGTVYRPDELARLTEFARSRGLAVHMDGARFANALAFTGCSPAELSWRTGIDVLSFGGTKNGCLAAEAVIYFNTDHAADFEYRRKRSGHLLSKLRYVAAQYDAYLQDELWLHLANHANAMAQRLSDGLRLLSDVTVCYPTEINEVFASIPIAAANELRRAGAVFFPWGDAGRPFTTAACIDSFVPSKRPKLR